MSENDEQLDRKLGEALAEIERLKSCARILDTHQSMTELGARCTELEAEVSRLKEVVGYHELIQDERDRLLAERDNLLKNIGGLEKALDDEMDTAMYWHQRAKKAEAKAKELADSLKTLTDEVERLKKWEEAGRELLAEIKDKPSYLYFNALKKLRDVSNSEKKEVKEGGR